MKVSLRKNRIVALVIAIVMLSGCGETVVTPENTIFAEPPKPKSMLEEAEIMYTKEEMRPGILVDLIGYIPEGEKVAIVETSIMPNSYDIVDAKTGDVVYTGEIHITECPEDGEDYTGYADFTDFTDEGTYYIQAELIGRSADFKIKKGLYNDLFEKTIAGLNNLKDTSLDGCYVPLEETPGETLEVSGGWFTGTDKQKDVCEGCLAMQDLMTANEFFPKAYTDDWGTETSGNKIPDILDEVMFEAGWLFKMQDTETGGVYTSVSLKQVDLTDEYAMVVVGETTRATAYFATTMARLSYIIKKYDAAFSKKCMEAANLAWKCLEANSGLVDATQMFRAAVEMYRATGYGAYKTIIDNYLKENADKDFEERIALDGAIVYMSSTRSTNVSYCTSLMDHYMSRTEDKSNSAVNSRYLVESGDRDEGVLLRNLVELIIVDYIISNKEYGTIEENYLHYLCGRNPDSEICSSLKDSPDAYAEFIVLLGKLSLLYKEE